MEVDEGFAPLLLLLLLLLLLGLEHALPLLFLLLPWLGQLGLRQFLHTRDFLPDGVSALNSVEVGVGSGASVFVVVVGIGCRQQGEEDTEVVAVTVSNAVATASTVLAFDAAAVAAAGTGDADVTVFAGSFALVSCMAVFNIFSSPSAADPCRAAAAAHRGHSPTLNGCSSLLCASLWFNCKSFNLSLISHTELGDAVTLLADNNCCCCSCCCRSCC